MFKCCVNRMAISYRTLNSSLFQIKKFAIASIKNKTSLGEIKTNFNDTLNLLHHKTIFNLISKRSSNKDNKINYASDSISSTKLSRIKYPNIQIIFIKTSSQGNNNSYNPNISQYNFYNSITTASWNRDERLFWINGIKTYRNMCDCTAGSLDLKTPRNAYLTAFYKRSFAHYTVKIRMPVILTQVIDSLVRNKEEIKQQYGGESQQELKMVIGELSKLKYEIQTNKPFRNLTSNGSDIDFYNNYIMTQSEIDGNVSFFSTIWLLAECYMYRRIREAFEQTTTLNEYDPFMKQKQDAFFQALPLMLSLGKYLLSVLEKSVEPRKDEFVRMLKLNLWGNKCDLSLSNGEVSSDIEELFNLEKLDPNILCDHTEKIWDALYNKNANIIDIVCDNSGYEIFTDFCLADYLITNKIAQKIRFHVKKIPWFISDVMFDDFMWVLNELKANSEPSLQKLGENWTKYVDNEIWTINENDFWTLPVDYTYMASTYPLLYNELAEADLIIFKGDLNYRKLFGERNWDPTTPIDQALQNFNPAKLCTLRTIKADIVCGIPAGVAEKMEAINEKWMETGDYGLIQFSEKIVTISLPNPEQI